MQANETLKDLARFTESLTESKSLMEGNTKKVKTVSWHLVCTTVAGKIVLCANMIYRVPSELILGARKSDAKVVMILM